MVNKPNVCRSINHTCVYGGGVVVHPEGSAEADEGGQTEDEDVAGGVQVHVLQVRQPHRRHHACPGAYMNNSG